jgi:signal peptide peptidase SppA
VPNLPAPVFSLAAITVPAFNRLDDWLGLWAMEDQRFGALCRACRVADWPKHLAAGPPQRPMSLTEMVPAKNGQTVAVISAAGTLMKSQSSFGGTSTVQLRREVRSAANDPNVSAILLRIDSPGGTVSGTADAAGDIKAARRKKPVWAHIEDLGASAAYWLASQADMVFANNPTAMVGSIGTYVAVADLSAAAEREGVKVHLFTTGPLKGMGDQAAHVQRLVNDTQTHFDEAVRKGRGMTATQLGAVRSGGMFPATEAVGLKLIDGVRSLDSTLESLASAK